MPNLSPTMEKVSYCLIQRFRVTSKNGTRKSVIKSSQAQFSHRSRPTKLPSISKCKKMDSLLPFSSLKEPRTFLSVRPLLFLLRIRRTLRLLQTILARQRVPQSRLNQRHQLLLLRLRLRHPKLQHAQPQLMALRYL
jgi:hypothetical protein